MSSIYTHAFSGVLNKQFNESWRKKEHHTHDDEYGNNPPNEIEDFLGFVVKEEVHSRAFLKC